MYICAVNCFGCLTAVLISMFCLEIAPLARHNNEVKQMFCWSLRPSQVNGLLLMFVRIFSSCLFGDMACCPVPQAQVIKQFESLNYLAYCLSCLLGILLVTAYI